MTFRGIKFTLTYDDAVITVPIDQSLQNSSDIQDFVKTVVPSADLPDTAVTEKETEENQIAIPAVHRDYQSRHGKHRRVPQLREGSGVRNQDRRTRSMPCHSRN